MSILHRCHFSYLRNHYCAPMHRPGPMASVGRGSGSHEHAHQNKQRHLSLLDRESKNQFVFLGCWEGSQKQTRLKPTLIREHKQGRFNTCDPATLQWFCCEVPSNHHSVPFSKVRLSDKFPRPQTCSSSCFPLNLLVNWYVRRYVPATFQGSYSPECHWMFTGCSSFGDILSNRPDMSIPTFPV